MDEFIRHSMDRMYLNAQESAMNKWRSGSIIYKDVPLSDVQIYCSIFVSFLVFRALLSLTPLRYILRALEIVWFAFVLSMLVFIAPMFLL
jgi:hypothetical protein